MLHCMDVEMSMALFLFLIGKYPVEAVHIMASVCREAEVAMFHRMVFNEIRDNTPTPTETGETIAIAAVNAAYSQNAGAIICLTTTGRYVCVYVGLGMVQRWMGGGGGILHC